MDVTIRIPQKCDGILDPYYEHVALFGGRGSAKSHTVAEALVLESCQGFQRVTCARQYAVSNEGSTHQLIADKIVQHNMGAYFQVLEEEIRGPHGSTFSFVGIDRNPMSLKSLEGVTRFWGEEAATFSQRSLNIILPTVRKAGSKLIWTWNPDSPDDPVDKLFRGPNPPPRSLVVEMSYLDNEYFEGSRLQSDSDALKARDPLEWAHVYGGKYRRLSDAAIFRRWKVGRIDTDGLEPLFGLDFGFSTDPAALIKFYVDTVAKVIYIAAESYAAGVETEAYPEFLDRVPEARRFPIIADSARPDLISYLQRHGFPMTRGALKGPGSVEDGITWLQGYDIVIDPQCPHTKRDFENYAYKVDKHTLTVLPVIAKGFDHSIDAIRYGAEDLRRGTTGVKVGRVKFG